MGPALYSQAPVILIGDTSFAHHLRNELSALETIIRSNCLSPGSQILVAREPLGNIEEIGHNNRWNDSARLFAIAQCATVYLCHTGSIQHKIGWTANVPGIIHGNRRLPASELVARHSSRLENGVPPMLMPGELLCDVAGDEREPNYTCIEPAEFSRLVLAHFRRCLALAPCVPG